MNKFLLIFLLLLVIGKSFAQQYKSHKVVKGENVYRIAKRYNVTPELIYKINPTAKDGIAEGEILAIPVMGNEEYNTHVVEDGDTVYSLSKKYNVSTETIYLLNPEATKGINVGQILNVGKINKETKSILDNYGVEDGKQEVLDSLKVDTDEKKIIRFINHTVKRKETLYGIAKQYKITVEDIKRHNKRLYSEQIKKKDQVRIPIFDKASDIGNGNVTPISSVSSTTKYRIQPKDTKYSIARRHGITLSEFDALNPNLDPNLPVGSEIVVPTLIFVPLQDSVQSGFELYEVKPQETIYSILGRTKISSDSLFAMNPYLRDGLKAGMVITLPVVDTMSVDAPKEKYINLQKRLYNFTPKKLAVMLPFCLDTLNLDVREETELYLKNKQSLRISLDLYSGVMIAVDSARVHGITTELTVFDTQKSNNKQYLKKLLEENSFDETDVVIGPLYQTNAEIVASELKKYDTPIFSPASRKESKINSNFFQTRPTNVVLQDKLIAFAKRDSLDKNIVLIVQKGEKHAAIKEKLISKFPNAKIAKIEDGNYLYEVRLAKVLDANKPNWVFLESNDVAMISNVIPLLNAKSESHKITLFTTDKNGAFDNDNIKNEHLSKLHLHYPSVLKEFDDKGMEEVSKKEKTAFEKRYYKEYGVAPSNWAVRGFDIAYDVLMRLGTADDLYHSVSLESSTEYIENKFKYSKKLLGGYYNEEAYLIKFDDDLKLEVIE